MRAIPRLILGAAFASLLSILAPAPGSAADEGARADLEAFRTQYLEQSPVLTAEARARGLALLRELEEAAAGIDDPAHLLGLMRIVALADNGHDMMHPGERSWRPRNAFPMRMIWFPDALILARTAPELADLAGAEVLDIDGHGPAALMERLRPFQGGKDEFRRWQMDWAFNSPDALHAMGIARSAGEAAFRLRLRDGRVVTRTVRGVPTTDLPPPVMPQTLWLPTPLLGEAERGWTAAAPRDPVPLHLQEPERLFRMVPLPELDALFVQFRMNIDRWEEKIAPFVARVSEELRRSPPENLILDLRFDIGGDNTQNLELMRQMAETVRGRILVLVGNYTFSAGIASAAAIKRHGGAKVVLIGDAMGDRPRWWSEARQICLPGSGTCLWSSLGLWDLEKGCAAEAHCFGDRFDINVASLRPDVDAPLTARDWLEGRDPGMEAAARLLGKRPGTTGTR